MGFIELEKITKEYFMGDQKILAVNQASFSINQGELVVILGPSGAGKSTILNLLGGMDTATSGQLFVDGQDITALKESQLTDYRASEVGFVFQFYNLIPALTVYENIALIKEATSKALEPEGVLKSVGLWERRHLFPTQISGGEQQRTAIARALCKNPKLLLCDEPTGCLLYTSLGRSKMNNLLFNVENEIGVITINRPKALNALNSETLSELK